MTDGAVSIFIFGTNLTEEVNRSRLYYFSYIFDNTNQLKVNRTEECCIICICTFKSTNSIEDG